MCKKELELTCGVFDFNGAAPDLLLVDQRNKKTCNILLQPAEAELKSHLRRGIISHLLFCSVADGFPSSLTINQAMALGMKTTLAYLEIYRQILRRLFFMSPSG